MSRRSLDFGSKLSRLDSFLDNFLLMSGAGGKGKGGSKAPPREEPPSVASGEKINTTEEDMERGEGGGEKNKSGSQDIRSFLVAAQTATPKRQRDQLADFPGSEDQTAKRVPNKTQRRGEEESMKDEEQQQEEMEEYNIDPEEEWQKKLMRALTEEDGLTPEQAMRVMKRVMHTFKEKVADEAKKAAVRVHKEEVEAKKCRSSILMHNANKWVQGDPLTQGYSLGERVTSLVQRLCTHMVTVVDCFTIGQWRGGQMPTSVYITFGSPQQKGTFFRVLAHNILYGGQQITQGLKAISCRDAFPRALIEKAKELAQKGFQLRQNGKVAGFRVVARGEGCIPMLEVRERVASGQAPAWWKVHQEVRRVPVVAQPGTVRDQDGEGEWQEVNRRKTVAPKTGGGGAASGKGQKAKPAAAPRKPPTAATTMSVVADRRLYGGFLEGNDEDRFVEPY
jgi:hypothetical protein